MFEKKMEPDLGQAAEPSPGLEHLWHFTHPGELSLDLPGSCNIASSTLLAYFPSLPKLSLITCTQIYIESDSREFNRAMY